MLDFTLHSTLRLVTASIFMKHGITGRTISVHCSFLEISIWHYPHASTPTSGNDSVFIIDNVT